METLEKSPVKLTGVVNAWKANKHGDVDAVEIKSGAENFTLNFPPHTAKAIQTLVADGAEIELAYVEEEKHGPQADKKTKRKLQFIKSGGKELELKDLKPQKPEAETELLSVENFELVKTKDGEVYGIKAGDKLVHIRKEDKEIAKQLDKADKLDIKAVARTDNGFVNEINLQVYHFKSITVAGKEYVSKK